MKDFDNFYTQYKYMHRNKYNNLCHYIGTSIGIFLSIYGFIRLNPVIVLVAIIIGYIFSWFGHFVFEKNEPLAFKKPVWSFYADLLSWYELNRDLVKFIFKK